VSARNPLEVSVGRNGISGPGLALPAWSAPGAGPGLSVACPDSGTVRDAVPATRSEIQIIFPQDRNSGPDLHVIGHDFQVSGPVGQVSGPVGQVT